MSSHPKNIIWHSSDVSAEDRRKSFRQKGCVLWFTGLSGSGKSTIAHALEEALIQRGRMAYVLDGDNVRHGLNGDLSFSPADRDENIRRIAEVARLFMDCGVICITAFISPFSAARSRAKAIIGAENFLEIYMSAELSVCEKRDCKGLYKKARAGEITDFTGIGSPFEPPENPDRIVDTASYSIEKSVEMLIGLLVQKKVI